MQTSNLALMVAIAALSLSAVSIAARLEAEQATTITRGAAWLGLDVGPLADLDAGGPGRSSMVAGTTSAGTTLGGPTFSGTTRTRGYVAWDTRAVGERGTEALRLIDYPWQDRLPGWTIRFRDANDGAYGYTLTRESVIDIYVRSDQSRQLLAHVIAHELGHAVDVTMNDGDDRRRWQEARGIDDAPWWPDNRAADFATGAGDFAESFAAWQVGAESFRSELAGPPSRVEQSLLAELARG